MSMRGKEEILWDERKEKVIEYMSYENRWDDHLWEGGQHQQHGRNDGEDREELMKDRAYIKSLFFTLKMLIIKNTENSK